MFKVHEILFINKYQAWMKNEKKNLTTCLIKKIEQNITFFVVVCFINTNSLIKNNLNLIVFA